MTSYQKDKLNKDAKTLVDIARMLDTDGRFRVLPSVLRGIADDVLSATGVNGNNDIFMKPVEPIGGTMPKKQENRVGVGVQP